MVLMYTGIRRGKLELGLANRNVNECAKVRFYFMWSVRPTNILWNRFVLVFAHKFLGAEPFHPTDPP